MIDPITLEVLREAFVSIVREMRVTFVRTAYSSILYEGEDFSCVLMDGHAQIVAMSKGQDHPLHIVPIGWSMKAVREKFGDDIHPGDIFLHNEPYTGGTHLNDVAMIYPLFAAGEMFVFPVVRAHWGDVGGMRRAIRGLRAGEYVYEAHLEAGTERLEPLTVRAKVTIAGDTITVDLAGTSPQTLGPTNVGPAMAPTGAFTIIKSFLDSGSDVNSGAFRPLTVLTPPGTIVNADPPAPCGGMVEVKYCVESAVMGALARALDGK